MRLLLGFLGCPLLSLFALVPSAALADVFEGELEATLSGQPGSSMSVHAWYSGSGDVRIDTSGKSPTGELMRGSTIMPSKGSSYYSISHNQKVVVVVPYASLRASSADVAQRKEADLEVKRLGREKVSGVMTEHVRVLDKDNNATIDLWMTPEYPPDLWTQAFRGRNLGLEVSDQERVKAMKRYGVKPGFAMKMKVRQAGRPPVEFLVDRISRGKVPRARFALPDGYKRIERASGPSPSAPKP